MICMFQFWMLTVNNDIRMRDGCLDFNKAANAIVVNRCSNKTSQRWLKKVRTAYILYCNCVVLVEMV